jgi:hypothetical protein
MSTLLGEHTAFPAGVSDASQPLRRRVATSSAPDTPPNLGNGVQGPYAERMRELTSVTSTADLTSLYTASGIVAIAWYVLVAVALWKVFVKAGYPGILAIVPIVNVFVLVKIAGYSAWLGLLFLIPVVGWIFSAFVAFRLGSAFGKGGVFSFFLLWIFSFVGYFILGFGDARYTRPV